MNEPQSEEKQYRLSNLVVNSIGLVCRGANRKPFYFVKSADGTQGEDMSDETQETQVEISPDELEEFRAWKVAQANPKPATADPVTEPTVDFAEMLAQERKAMQEEFAAKLEAERTKTEKLAEAFAEEQRKRRLMQFTDQAATFSNLPVSPEQFGEDLMTLADSLPQETFDRLIQTLRASDEAIEQGDLFSQFAQPVRSESGDPFMAKVEGLKAEIIKVNPLMNDNEAFADAMTKAEERYPDLARAYAIRSVGGV